MYHCSACGREFLYAKVYFEPTPIGSERLLLCPFCDSMDFHEKKGDYCSYCGRHVPHPGAGYCSDSCRSAGEKLYARQKEQEEKRKNSPLYKAVAEVDRYNRIHGCTLSYGQYYALKGAGML